MLTESVKSLGVEAKDVSLLIKGTKMSNEELISEWVLSKMEGFSKFLGFSCEEFDKETYDLF